MPGTKFDGDKIRMDLLDPLALEGTGNVLTHGAVKYGDRNWEGGLAWGRLFGAVMRHLWAFWRGEDLDPESGLPHVDHAACGIMMLQREYRTRKDLDDRPVISSSNVSSAKGELGVVTVPNVESSTSTRVLSAIELKEAGLNYSD